MGDAQRHRQNVVVSVEEEVAASAAVQGVVAVAADEFAIPVTAVENISPFTTIEDRAKIENLPSNRLGYGKCR